MGILISKKNDIYCLTCIARLALVGIAIALAASFVDTIWSVYMEDIFHSMVLVSFVSAILPVVAFICYFSLVPVVEKYSKSKIFIFSLFFIGLSYILFSFSKNALLFIISSIILTIFVTLRISSFGIMIRDKSNKRFVSRNEGIIYTALNISWLLGPLIAGYISENLGMSSVFLVSAALVFCSIVFFRFFKIRDLNIRKKLDRNLINEFRDFFKNKYRTFAYLMLCGQAFWYSIIYILMPIYIIQNGLGVLWIGYFLFAFTLPLVLFEYKFAKIAAKVGFKKIFSVAFFILSISALLCFFVSNIYAIFIILIASGIGIAMLEPNTEAHFFDVLTSKKEEPKFYGPYNTSVDIGSFSARVLSGVLLIFLPFKFVFLLFGGVMLVFFLISFRVKGVVEERRR